jgi:Protein of unknown function (DUF2938)
MLTHIEDATAHIERAIASNLRSNLNLNPMKTMIEFAFRSLVIGAGATLLMDLWAAALSRFGITSLNFALLGRWIGHLPRGQWFHESIAKSPPVPLETWIGWSAHYTIGISFAALLLAIFGLPWVHTPTLLPALLVGVATVVAPWFILQPALGFGVASRKTPKPIFNAVKSLVTHVVFGLGLFLAAWCLTLLVPLGR